MSRDAKHKKGKLRNAPIAVRLAVTVFSVLLMFTICWVGFYLLNTTGESVSKKTTDSTEFAAFVGGALLIVQGLAIWRSKKK